MNMYPDQSPREQFDLGPYGLQYRLFFDFSLTVKAAPHECVIRTGQP